MVIPPVPPQLQNDHASWATECYRYLLKLVAALITIITNNGNVITYQQGGVANPSQGIYVTWASAYAAANAIRWLLPTIVIDNAFGQAAMTSGAWNLNYITLLGAIVPGQSNSGYITIMNGAIITGANILVDAVMLNSVATSAPPITVTGIQGITLTNGASLLTDDALSTQPFCQVTASGVLGLYLSGNASLRNVSGGGGTAIVATAASANVTVDLSEAASLQANTLTGSGTIAVRIFDQSVAYSQVQPGATGITWAIGGGTVSGRVQAVNTSTPTINSGPAPGSQQVITGWTPVTNQSPTAGGSFNGTTFTVDVPDFYQITAALEFAQLSGGAAGSEFTIAIYRTPNGGAATLIAEGVYENPVASLVQKRQLQVSIALALNPGDTIDIRASQNTGAAIILTNSATRNFMSIATAT